MQFGLDMINVGTYADPRVAVQLAQAAEANGWQGFFMWDHHGYIWNGPSADPWITLAAVAASTKQLKIGPAVTPLARRRPHVVAAQLVTLDVLSSGRVIFGAGLGGVADEFTAFGQPFDAQAIAAMLDEGLDVLMKLWSGEPVTHHGQHYTVENVTFQPKPVQQPRIPIWIGGESVPALRRAARWDGWIVGVSDMDGTISKTPEAIAKQIEIIRSHRTDDAPSDVVVMGCSQKQDRSLFQEYEDAGVSWWLESIYEMRGSYDEMLARVKAGPV